MGWEDAQAGALLGLEQTLKLNADLFSGENGIGYFAPGLEKLDVLQGILLQERRFQWQRDPVRARIHLLRR
jgi:hypothetical protein